MNKISEVTVPTLSVEIPLTQGKVAIIDATDAERVLEHTWYAVKDYRKYYAKSRAGRYSPILMHRFILDAPDDKEVDHINHDGLDNRRCNLRLTNRSGNARNRDPRTIKGYTIDGLGFRNKPYKVSKNGKHIGRFATPEEATEAYWNA